MFNLAVKESCFKHLEDVTATSVCDVTLPRPSATINLVPSTSFCFKVKARKL